MSNALHHRFLRRVAFGLAPGQTLPASPLDWALAQVQAREAPPIDWLDPDGQPHRERPELARLRWTMDEVMHAFHAHQEAERRSFAMGRTGDKAAYEALRRTEVSIPYHRMAHWIEVQARVTTALYGAQPVFERFWHFWTNHFMVAPGNQNNDTLVGPYQRHLRALMGGSYRDMLWSAVTHPGMLVYLDNNENTGPNSRAKRERWTRHTINENLGRELLELFTLSPAAGYTQKDVDATTLILTGWRDMKPDRYRPVGVPLGTYFDFNRHEPGSQTVLGKRYQALLKPSAKLEDLVTDLAAHPATAEHMARKLCTVFVDDEPPAAAVAAVRQAWIDSQGHLPTVHQAVLQAVWTHLPTTRKFSTPEAWLIQTLGTSGLPPPAQDVMTEAPGFRTIYWLGDLGQPLPRCPQPNGWPIRSADWISKEMLDRRVRLSLVLQRQFASAQPDGKAFFEQVVAPSLPDTPDARLVLDTARAGRLAQAFVLWHASPSMMWS